MKTLVYDQTPRVVAFMHSQMAYRPKWAPDVVTLGIERDGQIIGAAAFESFDACNVNMHVAGIGSHWATKEFVFKAFYFPFMVMNLRRVSTLVASRNEASLRLALRLGFSVEGVRRSGLVDDDLILLGMLREECRFIQGLK